MGEDLVLYKDLGGRFGLLDRHCPHRRADLAYGFVEQNGIRCNYHGWLMDETGRCIEQPYDDTVNPRSRAKERCGTKAYPVQECAGLLWAYMGPQPVPELPVWEPFTWENGFRESRALRRALQLVSVPGELLRPRALRMDARQLEPAARPARPVPMPQASQAQVRGVRLRLHLQARARGLRRAQSVLDRRPRRAVAERLLSRQPFRMARAGRRREHAERGVVLHARAEGARALCAGQGPDLGQPDQGRARPLDFEPRHQPGHHRLGRAGRASPTAPRRTSAPATSASP